MKQQFLWTAVLAIFLVGCSEDDKQQAENIEKPIEEATQKPDASISDEAFHALVEKASDEAFSTTEHEGTIAMQETHTMDGEVKESYRHTTSYRQNEAQEGMYGEHQLYYERHLDGYENLPITFEGYVQPDVAFYTYSDKAGWNGYDFQQMGEVGLERFSYLAPADVISMLEMNPDTLKVVSVDDEYVVAAFDPTAEDQISLLYSILELESIYHQTDMSLQVKSFTIQLSFNKTKELLEGIDIQIEFDNAENEKEMLTYVYKQLFKSFALTDEIRPPNAIFSESGLTLWD